MSRQRISRVFIVSIFSFLVSFFSSLFFFVFPLWTDVLNFLYHHFLLLLFLKMWLEKYLSTILVVITRAKRIVVAMPSLSFPSSSSSFFQNGKTSIPVRAYKRMNRVEGRRKSWFPYAERVAYQWAWCADVVICMGICSCGTNEKRERL